MDMTKLVACAQLMDSIFGKVEDMSSLDASYFVDNSGTIYEAGRLAHEALTADADISECKESDN